MRFEHVPAWPDRQSAAERFRQHALPQDITATNNTNSKQIAWKKKWPLAISVLWYLDYPWFFLIACRTLEQICAVLLARLALGVCKSVSPFLGYINPGETFATCLTRLTCPFHKPASCFCWNPAGKLNMEAIQDLWALSTSMASVAATEAVSATHHEDWCWTCARMSLAQEFQKAELVVEVEKHEQIAANAKRVRCLSLGCIGSTEIYWVYCSFGPTGQSTFWKRKNS